MQGHSYRGTQNTTISGYTCQRWDTTEPVFHSRIPSAFPNAGLVDNYCRNPDNEADVWCYTVDGPRWEKCGVPLCDEAAAPAAAVAAAVAEPAATPLGGASPAAAAAAVTDVGVAQEDTNVALGDESALSFEEAAAPEGEQADAPTAVLAGAELHAVHLALVTLPCTLLLYAFADAPCRWRRSVWHAGAADACDCGGGTARFAYDQTTLHRIHIV